MLNIEALQSILTYRSSETDMHAHAGMQVLTGAASWQESGSMTFGSTGQSTSKARAGAPQDLVVHMGLQDTHVHHLR